MKKIIFLLMFALIGVLLALGYVIFFSKNTETDNGFTSPIPNFLSISQNKQVSSINLWLPKLESFIKGNPELEISAKSVLMFDLNSKKVLFAKNPMQKLPMASLTKIMTAIIALENPKKDNAYLVHPEDLVGEDSMGLTKGEILNLDELLYGLILHSGNDAAETIASNFPGKRSAFIKAMNEKAIALGLKNTNFTNPTGLEGDGNQYTTAYDLMIITEYAMSKYPKFAKIAATFEQVIEATSTHKYFYIENETNLISSYPGVKGVKTGYTPEAGLCLVTYLEYKGNKIIGILLGSENRRQEMKNLLDYSLNTLGIIPPPHS